MRLVADTAEDFLALSLLQRQMTAAFKAEKGTGSGLETAYKKFIGTSIEKAYEKPGETVHNVSMTELDTDDPAMFLPYIVQAATNRKKIAIEYKDAKGKVSKRVLEPFNWRNDQLVAYCHERGAWRQFKLPQIMRIAITEDDFERPEEVEIKASDVKDMKYLVAI